MKKNIGTIKANKEVFTIGSDPEIFLAKSNGEIVSSIPVLKRDKNNPICLDKTKAINFYADNSLGELSFKPSKNREEFVSIYREALQKAQSHLGKDYRLMVKSAHTFKENELEAAHGIDPNEVGCNPEFNHWEQKINQLGPFTSSMRSGSAHIHVGHPKLLDFDTRHHALAMIEIFLGCGSIIWDNDETSLIRRQKYGTSGSFRITDYGFETRFMSNYMLNSPKLVELAYDLVEYSLSHIFNNTFKGILNKVKVTDIRTAIDTCNKKLAEKVLVQAGLPKEFMNRIKNESNKVYKAQDLYKNWNIEI